MIYLAYLVGLTAATWIPLYRIFTSEDRHARLRVPAIQDQVVPLLASHSNTGLV